MGIRVELRDLDVVYPGTDNRDPVHAVDAVSFSVEAGTLTALIGPSGCGKTTVLNVLAGFVGYEGTVLLDGKRPGKGREMGYLFQQNALFPWRTLRKNVEFALEIRGVGKSKRRARASELLASVGLADFEDAYPAQISGGMAKRAGLVQVLIHEPQLLLLDEPFGALDAFTRAEVENDFLDLVRTTKTTCLFVTHNLQEAIALSDQVVIFSARPGRVVRIHDVDLPWPREIPEVQYSAEFAEIEQAIWDDLRPEVAASETRSGSTQGVSEEASA